MIKQVLRAEWFNQLPEALSGGIWSYQSTMGPGGEKGGSEAGEISHGLETAVALCA